MADEVGDCRRDRVTENTSRLRLDFLFRANNIWKSPRTLLLPDPVENSHGRPGEQQNDAESASLEGSKRARPSVGGGDQMAVPPRADPRDPAVTRQQLPLRSSLWNLQHSAAQSRTHCAPKFGVRLSNCHMAVGLWGRRSVVSPPPAPPLSWWRCCHGVCQSPPCCPKAELTHLCFICSVDFWFTESGESLFSENMHKSRIKSVV